jgi:hypothetical protein
VTIWSFQLSIQTRHIRFDDEHLLTTTPFITPLGANVIYKNILQPIFNKHESDIDAALNSIDAKSVIEAALAAAQTSTTKGKEN